MTDLGAPTLFDRPPLVRSDDPDTSRHAAERVAPGNSELMRLIRGCVAAHGPLTAFQVAELIEEAAPGRWSESTVRAAVSRAAGTKRARPAGLARFDDLGLSPRGQKCERFVTETRP